MGHFIANFQKNERYFWRFCLH